MIAQTITGEGPIRRSKPTAFNPADVAVGAKTRVLGTGAGGARRVPLLPPSKEKEDDSTATTTARSTSESVTRVNKVGQGVSGGTSRPAPSKPATSTNKTKPVPVPKLVSKPATSSSSTMQSGSSQSKPPPPQPQPQETKRKPNIKGSHTQPTLAQLARAKAAAELKNNSKNGTTAAKPTWGGGRSVSSSNSTKGLVVKDKGKVGVKVASKAVAPEAVPLPPSPTPASVPLPSSPHVQKEDEKAGVGTSEPEVLEEPLTTTLDGEGSLSAQHPHDHGESQTNGNPTNSATTTDPEGTPNTMQIPFPSGPLPNTPISNLLTSIQQGFLFSPCSPLSPPQSYLRKVGTGVDEDAGTPQLHRDSHLTHDLLDLVSNKAVGEGQRIPSVVEMGAKFAAVDEADRQVLSDVEVNR